MTIKLFLCFAAISLLIHSVAFSIEPRRVLVGSPTASYYLQGAFEGTSRKSGNIIEIYNRGAFAGKIELGGTIQFYDRSGASSGRAQSSGNRITLYNKRGLAGSIVLGGSKSTFYNAAGALDGWAITSGNITTFYDSNGKRIGRKQ